ncbi:MAG: serine O-acetyltransferase [Bacteriovoracaceae bacterium]
MSSKLADFLHKERHQTATIVINIPEVRQSLDQLLCLIYPQRGQVSDSADLESVIGQLKKKFTRYVESVAVLEPGLRNSAQGKVEAFFEGLPEVTRMLDLDATSAFQGDPAAYSREEIIITYPGFYAVCIYRLAHAFHTLGIPLLPRLMSEYAHEKTGIDIHPGAKIGESFFIDHGTGVVIGETSNIGKNVKIYQGVTLGALSVKKKLQSVKRHPTIEDDVVIYANSTILGGETVVGQGSIIGGNVWLTESVAAQSIIFNKLEAGQK